MCTLDIRFVRLECSKNALVTLYAQQQLGFMPTSLVSFESITSSPRYSTCVQGIWYIYVNDKHNTRQLSLSKAPALLRRVWTDKVLSAFFSRQIHFPSFANFNIPGTTCVQECPLLKIPFTELLWILNDRVCHRIQISWALLMHRAYVG